jgi:predicted acetyltransferase
MELVHPDITLERTYLEAVSEYKEEKRDVGFDFKVAESDFGRYVSELRGHEEGKFMPSGYVPETVYWLVDSGEYVGRISIRHTLTERLRTIGGHIGYDVRPSKRGRGYATKMLGLALEKCREMGIERVLITCDETNAASRRVIEKNDGVLENMVPNPEGGPDKLRYWIDLARAAA